MTKNLDVYKSFEHISAFKKAQKNKCQNICSEYMFKNKMNIYNHLAIFCAFLRYMFGRFEHKYMLKMANMNIYIRPYRHKYMLSENICL